MTLIFRGTDAHLTACSRCRPSCSTSSRTSNLSCRMRRWRYGASLRASWGLWSRIRPKMGTSCLYASCRCEHSWSVETTDFCLGFFLIPFSNHHHREMQSTFFAHEYVHERQQHEYYRRYECPLGFRGIRPQTAPYSSMAGPATVRALRSRATQYSSRATVIPELLQHSQ